jgi:hypothetical protein
MPVRADPERPDRANARVYHIGTIRRILKTFSYLGQTLHIEEPAMFPMVQPTCRTCRVPVVCPKCQHLASKTKNATAAASQARCHALFEAFCLEYDIKFKVVPAKAWQKVILGKKRGDDTKKASIAWAQRHYPNVSLLRTKRCRKPSHGFSDALGIMEYGQRVTVVA